MPVLHAPAVAPVVFCLDDNLVLTHETLGRIWAKAESWPVNDNRDDQRAKRAQRR